MTTQEAASAPQQPEVFYHTSVPVPLIHNTAIYTRTNDPVPHLSTLLDILSQDHKIIASKRAIWEEIDNPEDNEAYNMVHHRILVVSHRGFSMIERLRLEFVQPTGPWTEEEFSRNVTMNPFGFYAARMFFAPPQVVQWMFRNHMLEWGHIRVMCIDEAHRNNPHQMKIVQVYKNVRGARPTLIAFCAEEQKITDLRFLKGFQCANMALWNPNELHERASTLVERPARDVFGGVALDDDFEAVLESRGQARTVSGTQFEAEYPDPVMPPNWRHFEGENVSLITALFQKKYEDYVFNPEVTKDPRSGGFIATVQLPTDLNCTKNQFTGQPRRNMQAAKWYLAKMILRQFIQDGLIDSEGKMQDVPFRTIRDTDVRHQKALGADMEAEVLTVEEKALQTIPADVPLGIDTARPRRGRNRDSYVAYCSILAPTRENSTLHFGVLSSLTLVHANPLLGQQDSRGGTNPHVPPPFTFSTLWDEQEEIDFQVTTQAREISSRDLEQLIEGANSLAEYLYHMDASRAHRKGSLVNEFFRGGYIGCPSPQDAKQHNDEEYFREMIQALRDLTSTTAGYMRLMQPPYLTTDIDPEAFVHVYPCKEFRRIGHIVEMVKGGDSVSDDFFQGAAFNSRHNGGSRSSWASFVFKQYGINVSEREEIALIAQPHTLIELQVQRKRTKKRARFSSVVAAVPLNCIFSFPPTKVHLCRFLNALTKLPTWMHHLKRSTIIQDLASHINVPRLTNFVSDWLKMRTNCVLMGNAVLQFVCAQRIFKDFSGSLKRDDMQTKLDEWTSLEELCKTTKLYLGNVLALCGSNTAQPLWGLDGGTSAEDTNGGGHHRSKNPTTPTVSVTTKYCKDFLLAALGSIYLSSAPNTRWDTTMHLVKFLWPDDHLQVDWFWPSLMMYPIVHSNMMHEALNVDPPENLRDHTKANEFKKKALDIERAVHHQFNNPVVMGYLLDESSKQSSLEFIGRAFIEYVVCHTILIQGKEYKIENDIRMCRMAAIGRDGLAFLVCKNALQHCLPSTVKNKDREYIENCANVKNTVVPMGSPKKISKFFRALLGALFLDISFYNQAEIEFLAENLFSRLWKKGAVNFLQNADRSINWRFELEDKLIRYQLVPKITVIPTSQGRNKCTVTLKEHILASETNADRVLSEQNACYKSWVSFDEDKVKFKATGEQKSLAEAPKIHTTLHPKSLITQICSRFSTRIQFQNLTPGQLYNKAACKVLFDGEQIMIKTGQNKDEAKQRVSYAVLTILKDLLRSKNLLKQVPRGCVHKLEEFSRMTEEEAMSLVKASIKSK